MKRGFSLLEMMATMALIAVAAALLIPAYQKTRSLSLQATCLTNLRQFGMGVMVFSGEHNGLPYWDGKGSASHAEGGLSRLAGSTHPNFEGWVRPYLHKTKANRLRCPLVTPRERTETTETFNYAGNEALCMYYPSLKGLPVPASRVVLAAESSGLGANHSVHYNMTMWGLSESEAYQSEDTFASTGGSVRRAQYHGPSNNRGLHLFFLDGHTQLVTPLRGDWRLAPAYGTPDNGGYFYDRNQFKKL